MSRSAEDLRQCMSGALASGGAGDRRAQRPDGADAADAGLLWVMRGWNLGLRGSCRCYRRRPSGVGCARLSAVSTSQQAKAPACGYVALPPRRLRYGRPSDQAVQVRTAWPRGNATPFIPSTRGQGRTGPVRPGLLDGLVVPICGTGPAKPVVLADAVTPSGSGLDPERSAPPTLSCRSHRRQGPRPSASTR